MIGKSGYIDVDGTKSTRMRIKWAEEYDIQSNTSVVSVTLQFMAKSPAGYYQVTYYLDGPVKIGGQTVKNFSSSAGTDPVRGESQDVWYPANGKGPYKSGKITHNDDGTASVTISANISGYTQSGDGGSGWNCNVSRTVSLTTIPRASTIRATDGFIESAINIAVYRKANYSHSIKWAFGSLSGYVTETGGSSNTEQKFTRESINFQIPASFYAQIPNAKSGRLTLTCRTYYGANRIGSDQTSSCTVSCNPERCAPTVSGTAESTTHSNLTGSKDKFIRGISDVTCKISGAAKNSASIASRSINGYAVTDAILFHEITTDTFSFTVTDSRGFTSTTIIKKELVPYILLTNNPKIARLPADENAAALTFSGDFWNGNFGAAKNVLSASYQVDSGPVQNAPLTVSGSTYSQGYRVGNLSYSQSYLITVTVKDKVRTVTRQLRVDSAIPVADWGGSDMSINVPLKCEINNLARKYSSAGDQDEKNFEAWLDTVLQSMQGGTTVAINFSVYPAITGSGVAGTVYKSSSEYATVIGFSYSGQIFMKNKLSGKWNPTKVKSF